MAHGQMQQPRILVVDDDSSLNHLLQKVLTEQQGCSVDLATDGLAAMTWLQGSTAYDVVILDNYLLPGMNGIDVLRHMKQHYPQTKCIMITAVNEDVLAAEARALGADAILAKPFEVDHLLDLVRELSGKPD